MRSKRYNNWKGIFGCLLMLPWPLPLTALAESHQGSDCPRVEWVSEEGLRIEFGQHRFPDGSSDLAMSIYEAEGVDVKPVTYGGGETLGCRYTSLALVPGAGEEQWGWHLAWAGDKGVFYARMDGQAWVSSPPKRLGTVEASEIQLQVDGQALRLSWQEQHGRNIEVHQALSHDEGRSWEAAQPHSAD